MPEILESFDMEDDKYVLSLSLINDEHTSLLSSLRCLTGMGIKHDIAAELPVDLLLFDLSVNVCNHRSVAAAICQSLAEATTKVGPALITNCSQYSSFSTFFLR